MRISDWSSDVCSSDLEPALRRTGMTGEAVRLRHHLGVLPGPRAEIMLTQEGRILGDTAWRAGGCHPAHVIAQAAATRCIADRGVAGMPCQPGTDLGCLTGR